MADALGWVQVPVVPVFKGIQSKLQSGLVKPAESSAKKAGASIEKNLQSGADAAAKQVEKSNWRVKKSAEELQDAEAKLSIETKKSNAAAIELSAAEKKLAEMKESGSATSQQLAKAEADVERKRAKLETTALGVEKAERGVEKAKKESKNAAESLSAAEKILKESNEQSAEATEKLGAAMEAADGKGQGFELSLGKVAAAGAVVMGAIGAAGKAAYEIGAQFDDAYDTIRVGTGASGAAFEDLQESMRNVARDSIGVGSDMGEIGTTLADLNTRLGVTGEPLEKLTTQFQQLKGMGMETDINAMAGAFQQFGVEAEDMPAMLDSVFQISQATGRDMTALVDNLSKSGPALKEFGFGLEESAGLLGALDKAGLDADKTMNSMTKALSEFAKEGKDPQRELWGMISKIDELTAAGKSAEAIDLANSIFGARGGAGFVAAVESGTFAYDDFMDSLGASSDTIGGLAEETADFSERWDQFKLQAMLAVEPVAAMVFDSLVPALDMAQDAFGNAMEAVQGFAEWVQRNTDWLIPLGAGLTVVAGGLAAIALQQKIVAAGGLIKFMKDLSAVTKIQTGVQAAFNLVMAANPIVLVTMAIAGLVAGLVVFFTKTETGQRIWQNFTQNLGEMWERFKERFHEVIASITQKFEEWKNNTQAVIESVKGFFTAFGNKVRDTSDRAISAVKSIPKGIKNAFKNAGTWLVDAGKQMIRGFIDGIKSMAGRVGDAVRAVVPDRLERFVPGLHFGGLAGFARGGVLPDIPGISRDERDPILGYSRERRMPIARIEPGEFVVNREATAKHLPLLYAINEDKYNGRQVDGLPGFSSGGVIGAMTKLVKDAFPMLTVTSAFRPGDSGYHGKGLAVDFSNGTGNTPEQLALAKAINRVYPESAQLIYAAPGWSGNIWEGQPAGAMDSGIYKTAQAGRHDHHVHWAMKTPPTKPLNGPAGSSGGAVKQGPANLPAMKWPETMLTVNAVRAGRAVALQFPEVKTIGGYRPSDPYPDHPSGRALDIMTYTDKALGDRILDFLFDNNEFFKMRYAIWQQAMWYKKGAPQPMADRGSPTQNHMDHVHAYFEPSPRVNGTEVYPNTIGAGGLSAARDAGESFIGATGAADEAKDIKQFSLPNVDYGTAAQLASKWDENNHRGDALREYLRRNARVYDKGGIVPKGGVMVNLDDPEVVFPKQESATLLYGMKFMPGVAQHLEVIARHSPKTAAAIEQVANSEMGERLATGVAFIGDQLREMADGANMRSYLSSMSVSEGVGLADQIGQLAGVTQIGSLFGGMAKGYESMQDAAVQQVDAANAVRQAEDNLASARKQYAQMLAESGTDPELSTKTTRKVEDAERKLTDARKTGNAKKIADAERALSRVREDASEELKKSGSKNAGELLKASEAVTTAENERSKALGVVKMAASAAGQAQVAMALEAVEFVVKVGKWIKEQIDRIRQSYVDAKKALATGMGEIAKWAELVHEWQFQVASLQQKLVRGVNEQREAERGLHIAIHDRLTKQAAEEVNVAKARLGLDKEIKRGAKIAQLKMMGLHEDWDSYLAYEALASRGVMKEWSDQAISELYRYEATRAKAAKAELEGRISQLKAESALAAATRQNARNQADLLTAQERLIKMSAKVAGVDLAEATAGAQLAKLFAQMAEVQMGIEDDWKGRHGYRMGYQGRHANEYRGRLAQRDSIQRSIDAVLEESNLSLDGVDYDKMLKQMAYVQRHGGDALNVARSFMPKLVEAESSMMVHDSLKPIWDAQDKLKDENRQVEDFLAEIDLYEATSPLENSVKALEYTVQGLTDAAEAWQEGNEELRGEYLHSARANRQAAESLGARWQIDPRYDTGNLRERIAKEETIYLDGEQMYTADQIDQLLAKVTDGSNVRYKIRSSSEVVNRRRERV